MISKYGVVVLFLFSIFALLCLACNDKQPTSQTSPSPASERGSRNAEKELSPWGELPSSIGSTERVQLPSFQFDLDVLIPQLPSKFGLAERSDIIFHMLRGNDYLFERPGEILDFQVLENPFSIRFKLVQVNQDLDVVQTVVEHETSEKKITVQLPFQENALFLLSLEALSEYDRVIDTAIYLIEIVPQVINAELSLDQTVFQANRLPETMLYLKNFGPNMLYFGGGYVIEKYEDGNWFRVSLPLSGSAMRYSVSAGEVHSQPLHIPEQLPAGKYRVVKDFQAKGVSFTSTEVSGNDNYLAAKFEVVEAR